MKQKSRNEITSILNKGETQIYDCVPMTFSPNERFRQSASEKESANIWLNISTSVMNAGGDSRYAKAAKSYFGILKRQDNVQKLQQINAKLFRDENGNQKYKGESGILILMKIIGSGLPKHIKNQRSLNKSEESISKVKVRKFTNSSNQGKNGQEIMNSSGALSNSRKGGLIDTNDEILTKIHKINVESTQDKNSEDSYSPVSKDLTKKLKPSFIEMFRKNIVRQQMKKNMLQQRLELTKNFISSHDINKSQLNKTMNSKSRNMMSDINRCFNTTQVLKHQPNSSFISGNGGLFTQIKNCNNEQTFVKLPLKEFITKMKNTKTPSPLRLKRKRVSSAINIVSHAYSLSKQIGLHLEVHQGIERQKSEIKNQFSTTLRDSFQRDKEQIEFKSQLYNTAQSAIKLTNLYHKMDKNSLRKILRSYSRGRAHIKSRQQ